MKKFLAILLVFLLVLSTFVACNSGNGGETEKPTDKQTEKNTEKDTEKDTEKQTEGTGNNSGNNNTGNNNNNNTGNENTGDNTGNDEPKAYRFGMTQANVDASKIFYLTGEMSSYYMATTDNMSEALVVYLEATEGGYYLYCIVEGVKTYINMVVSDTHVNGAYEAAASTVYTLDEENGTLKANITVAADETKSGEYWFGTRNDKDYTTVGPVLVKYEGFFCKLYDATKTEDAPVQQPEDDNTDDTPTCEHVDTNNDYKCDKECGSIVAPEADSVLTIPQANALGAAHEHNTFTAGKYSVTGVIVEVTNATHGNMTIKDANENILTVYGSYDATGTNKYGQMTIKHVAGDTVTVYGIIGQFNGNPQLKDGWVTVDAHEHNYVAGVCACGEIDTTYVPSHDCETNDGDLICDNPECDLIIIPAADSVLSIPNANTLGSSFAHDTYTEGKYYVTGVIVEITNTTHGNMIIKDANENTLTVYGSYDATGTNKYGSMTVKHVVGDTVTVYGIIGQYNDNPQMKDGWVTVDAHEHNYVAGICDCGVADPNYVAPEIPSYNTLATFEFGENVDVSAIEDETKRHSDGSAIAAGETFESGAYNLVIDSAENVYSNANDKTGLSCLKLGTSKKTATLSFTVGADVKQVVIKIAKYKANTTKISVNGGEAQSLTKDSDNGEYDEIIIDTTTNKTVTITTVTGGVRAMINSITFNG